MSDQNPSSSNALPSAPTAQLWLIDPRDPIVLGDGRASEAYVSNRTWPFPFPGTMAGMVRTTLLAGEGHVSPKRAKGLLKIQMRGPWLVEPVATDTGPRLSIRLPAPADVLLEEKPDQNPPTTKQQHCDRLIGGTLLKLEADEGVLWPSGADDLGDGHTAVLAPTPGSVLHLEERAPAAQGGAKRKRLDQAFWPLELVVWWNLGIRPDTPLPHPPATGIRAKDFVALAAQVVQEADGQERGERVEDRLLHREERIHVSLDDATGTAEASMLYSSGGLRLNEGWSLGVEVTVPPEASVAGEIPVPTLPLDEHLTLLGGESRPSFLNISSAVTGTNTRAGTGAFPEFSSFQADYVARARAAHGIRLQLLTPAYLPVRNKVADQYHQVGDPGWCPSWLLESTRDARPDQNLHPDARAILKALGWTLKLEAVCMPGYSVISGWNLQANHQANQRGSQKRRFKPDATILQRTGAPREVRRLVPAGSVYFLSVFQGKEAVTDFSDPQRSQALVDICAALWGQVIDPEGPGEDAANMLDDFRAPASSDGYGLILPGFW